MHSPCKMPFEVTSSNFEGYQVDDYNTKQQQVSSAINQKKEVFFQSKEEILSEKALFLRLAIKKIF